MSQVFTKKELLETLDFQQDLKELLSLQKRAFIDFSKGKLKLPLPLQISFPKENGDCHVKAGFREGDSLFLIKVVSGFYQNVDQGLPSSDGAILLFSQKTGALKAIIQDQGLLTTIRTALAAALASSLTPLLCSSISIIGTGQVAKELIWILKALFPKSRISLFGRNPKKVNALSEQYPFVHKVSSLKELCSYGGTIITATASKQAFLYDTMITKPTHIIALGSDEKGKQECDPKLFQRACHIFVDSLEQAKQYGDFSYAHRQGLCSLDQTQELGKILEKPDLKDFQLIMTDLSGLAAQDIAIVEYFFKKTSFKL